MFSLIMLIYSFVLFVFFVRMVLPFFLTLCQNGFGAFFSDRRPGRCHGDNNTTGGVVCNLTLTATNSREILRFVIWIMSSAFCNVGGVCWSFSLPSTVITSTVCGLNHVVCSVRAEVYFGVFSCDCLCNGDNIYSSHSLRTVHHC